MNSFNKKQDWQCKYKRNIEACSCKHCCSGGAISITHSACVRACVRARARARARVRVRVRVCVCVCVCVCSLSYPALQCTCAIP